MSVESSMTAATIKDRRLLTPAVLVMVALSMSAAGAGVQPSVASSTRPEVRIAAQEQTDAILRVVSEAARQFCGSAVDLNGDHAAAFIVHPQPLLWVLHQTQPTPATRTLHILPALIDLPPPALLS